MEHIFRAYDIRGIWNRDIDPAICLDIGRGLGSFLVDDLGMGSIAVGYDVRTSSKAFEGSLVSGLLSTGVNVISVGMCSFGVAMFTGWKEGMDASCYITASHLTPEWNGVKMYYGDGVGFPEENIIALRKRVIEKRFIGAEWDSLGSYRRMDYMDPYVDFWNGRFKELSKGRPLRVGVDCGGGAMCLSAPLVMESVGLDVARYNCDVDPHFKSRPSEPRPENLTDLSDGVVELGLDFGVAFDGDGDRTVVVDEGGRCLSPDTLGIVIAKELLGERGEGVILANVESSRSVEEALEPLGARVKRIKVGHTFLTLEAKEEKALFGIEKSGHLIIPEHVLFDDAMVIPLQLAAILKGSGRGLSELVDEIPQYPFKAEAADCPDEIKFKVVDALVEDLREEYPRIDTQDGVRVDTDEGWVLIRCSNTSPAIRITVEGRDDEALEGLFNLFRKRLSKKIMEMGD